ncbi:linalool dehydratase/isomerase domain-containing protein, partial [Nocardia salmonicida]
MSTTRAGQTGRWVPARLLPRASPFIPRATRWKLSVSVSICLAIWGTGALLAAVGPLHARTAAMALMLPGGGHLASGHIYRAIFALSAFGLSMLIWWMIGAVIAPIIVWLGILVEATLGHSHAPLSVAGAWVTAGSVPAILGSSLVVYSVRRYRQRATARTLNHELASVRFFRTAVPSTTEPAVSEASADDLAHLRFAIDLALQPLDEFTGFDRRDQFREAALRYQLCILGYALSMYRYTHTPAFSGYLDEAQQKAIVKMGNKQVWGYWAAENAWGRFSPNRDPVNNRDNVMLTGWQGVAVGMYESFGDDRFSRPGGLTYTWSDTQEFQHDFHTLAASIHRNFRRSPFTLFSCEPRWIYPVCNTFGVNTLVLHDRLHGTEYFRELEEAIDGAFENEFQRPDGRLIGVRNETLGLSWNIWASEGVSLPTT